jgi:uncharacterized surface protein with fasciclin (FAS1) repeats
MYAKKAVGAGFAVVAAACMSLGTATTASAEMVGPGCAGYAQQVPTGPGSVMGMAHDPVAVAASNNPMLTTLTKAVSGQLNPQVNLVDTLNSGEFTVFAPTDAAFEALPEGTLQSLLEPENQDQLTGILTYHVVPAEVPASQVMPGDVVTVNGAELTVAVQDGSVVLEDGQGNEAMVTQTDIEASNGVIHVIDAVLLPPSA